MKSILQSEKVCFLTGATDGLHLHHIFGGRNRKVSDENGFTVYLRWDYHVGTDYCVHKNHVLDEMLKQACQLKYEQVHSRDEFVKLIGKNYLD